MSHDGRLKEQQNNMEDCSSPPESRGSSFSLFSYSLLCLLVFFNVLEQEDAMLILVFHEHTL